MVNPRFPQLRRLTVTVCWGATVLLAGFCLVHIFDLTSQYWEIAVLSLTPWLLLPAWPISVYGALRGRWLLAASAAAVVACQLVWVGPVFRPWSDAAAPSGPARLRLFDANISQSNRNLRGIGREIAADHPQVVALEELTPVGYASLRATGALARFPFRIFRLQPGAGGVGLWSTLPLVDPTAWNDGDNQMEISASLPFGGVVLRVDVVHVYAPLGAGEPSLWRAQLRGIARELSGQPRPLVVAGDFNATADLPQFRAILNLGLHDAAVVDGKGWEMTWPRDQAWVLPYLRLDHILLSSQLTVTSYRLGTGQGSDHKPLVANLALAS